MNNNSKKTINQSGVIPFFSKDGETKIVLVTSMETRQWIIPKGSIEKDMSPQESAAKEALEEAGVEGIVSDSIFSEYVYEKWGGIYHVKIYLLEVKQLFDKWDEMKMRNRKVVDLSEAIKIIKPDQLEIMKKFSSYIQEKN